MTEFGPADVAFVGLGRSTPAYYRCAIPANALGIEWVGVQGLPSGGSALTGLRLVTGNVMDIPDLYNKKVVVLQQPSGPAWRTVIVELRIAGVKVLYEVDDWLDSVADADDHENREAWSSEKVEEHYSCMTACDGIIASTPWLAQEYSAVMRDLYNKDIPVFVCRNGLDLGRYHLSNVERETVTIGWAGGVGHKKALEAWLPAVNAIMNKYDHVGFVSIGAQHGEGMLDETRVLRIPPVSIENFPAVMRSVDIAIGPARESAFFRGKSDLRYLEASALGIPGVYHPLVYGDTAKAGYVTDDVDEVEECLETLVDVLEVRFNMGDAAQKYVHEERSAEAVSADWIKAFEEVT